MARPYQILPLGCGERDVMDQNSLGKPGSHQANKNCNSLSPVNSQPLHKSMRHREVKTAVHTCRGAQAIRPDTGPVPGKQRSFSPSLFSRESCVVPWHCACAFAFLLGFLGCKPCQATSKTVQEQDPMLLSTCSLDSGIGAELFPPAQEDWRTVAGTWKYCIE